MKFLKNFFNDESTIIGLCGFNLEKTYCTKKIFIDENFSNPFQQQRIFETNFSKNTLLL